MWETDWNERLHLKSHTSLLYSRWKTVCELSSMSDFTVFIKQINYYFWQDTEVCIQWAVYYPVRPQERFCEWQWSDTTDTHGSHDNDSVTNVVCTNREHVIPYRAVTRHHGDFSVMGTPSLQPFLKSYWLTPVKWLANCRKACKYDELETV